MKNFIIAISFTKPGIRKFGRRYLRLAALISVLALVLAACLPAQEGGGDNFLHPPTKSPTATLLPPEEIDLPSLLDFQGKASAPVVLEAPDGCARIEIDAGTTLLDAAGKPARRLAVQQDYPGKLPMEAYGVPISYAYRFGPDEIRFSTPVKIVFTCLKNFKRTMLSEMSLGMQSDDGKWEQLSVQGDDEKVWTRLEALRPGWRYLIVGPAPMGS